MSTLRKKFGQRLKQLRREQDMTQEILAERAEIHRTYPSKLENGLRGATIDTIEKLAEVLDVDPKRMFEFDDLDDLD